MRSLPGRGHVGRAVRRLSHIDLDPSQRHLAPVESLEVVANSCRKHLRERHFGEMVDVEAPPRGRGRQQRALVNDRLREAKEVLGHRVRSLHVGRMHL